MEKHKEHNFLKGAAILSVATILVKIIGALFKIPLFAIFRGNDMPAAITYFTSAYEIFSLLLIVGTAGLPVAVSKMVSAASSQGKRREVLGIFSVARVAFLWVGGISSLLMFIFAPIIANWVKGSEAAIRAIAPSVFLVCLMCPYRGVHQGHGNMLPTALSQLIESTGKLAVGLALVLLAVKAGTATDSTAAAMGILGVTIGSGLGALFLMSTWRKHKRVYTGRSQADEPTRARKSILRELLYLAIPVTIAAIILQLANIIDLSVALGLLMKQFNITKEAANAMFAPIAETRTIVGFPQSLVIAMAVSIIPAVSAAITAREKSKVYTLIDSAFRITGLLAWPCAFGIVALGTPVMQLLFTDGARGGPLMSIAALGILPVCMVSLTNAILQAMGKVYVPMVNMVVGGAVRVAATIVLVSAFGLTGAAISPILCYGLIALLNLRAIARVVPWHRLLRPFVRPLLASIIMGAVVYFTNRLLSAIVPNSMNSKLALLVCTAFSILIGVLVYGVLALRLRLIGRAELVKIPLIGKRLANWLNLPEGKPTRVAPIRLTALVALVLAIIMLVGMATLPRLADQISTDVNTSIQTTKLAAANDYVLAISTDGTALYAGENRPTALDGWQELVSVAANDHYMAAVTKQGKVLLAVKGEAGEPSPEDNRFGRLEVAEWQDIAAVACADAYVVGLKTNGTVIATTGAPDLPTADWQSLKAIACGPDFIIGLRANGTAVGAGYEPRTRYAVDSWREVTKIAAGESGVIGLTKSGGVLITHDPLDETADWKNIKSVATHGYYFVAVTQDGKLRFAGQDTTGAPYDDSLVGQWTTIQKAVIGDGFVAAVLKDNAVKAEGNAAIAEAVDAWKGLLAG